MFYSFVLYDDKFLLFANKEFFLPRSHQYIPRMLTCSVYIYLIRVNHVVLTNNSVFSSVRNVIRVIINV